MATNQNAFGYKQALTELDSITNWWLENSIDQEHGGFYGEIDYHGEVVADANKGIILNSRILWFLSQRMLFVTGQELDPRLRSAADRAFHYLLDHFDDERYGGVFWELAADGSLINGKKQIYALCFSIYGLITYYRATGVELALIKALAYFDAIEDHARDAESGGYFEAFSQQWQSLDDVRLSDVDMNAPKTMNTHLHILEAYTALHQAAPSDKTEDALRYVIDLFLERIIDAQCGHLKLFFDENWNSLTPMISYGHDIETSWLLLEAAEVLADPALLVKVRPTVEKMADICEREGISDIGHVCDAYDPDTGKTHDIGMWWVQAEGLVGFLNAFKLTGEQRYYAAFEKVWRHIDQFHIDRNAGEWHWLSVSDKTNIQSQYKVGFWKSPYHNGRAMMEICKIFESLEES